MASRNSRRISNRVVESLSVNKETVFWDRRLPGFGVRAYPSGSKVYIAQARGPKGSKRLTIGRHGVISADKARASAALAIARIVGGEDPQTNRRKTTRATGPTVADAAVQYLRGYVEVRCKRSTVQSRRSLINVHIVPAMGAKPLVSIVRRDVIDLQHRLASTPAQANQVLFTISQIFTYAQDSGIAAVENNPCKGVRPYKLRKRERFLTEREFLRLGRVMEQAVEMGEASPAAIAALRLLMLTGCRTNEILRLRWSDVDLPDRQLRLQDSKTGPRVVPLSPSAVKVLFDLQRTRRDEWVITGYRAGTHLSEVRTTWRRLRELAGLHDVRVHDLRHSFASTALALGESLPMIAKLLGHRRLESTVRYAHLARSGVHEAAERVACSLVEDILADSNFGDGRKSPDC